MYNANREVNMKRFILLITLLATLALPGLSDTKKGSEHHHQHSHQYVARASSYVAVCSKGDLHARFRTRAQAAAAARAHQAKTGHPTGVRKQ